MSDEEMRRVYRGLAKIEDSFKVTKTCFESRPVYVRTNDHIDAHFATCFLALVLMRLLEHKIDHVFPVGKILDSIKKYNCTHLDTNNWQFTYFDEILKACGKTFDIDLDVKYRTQQEIQRPLKYWSSMLQFFINGGLFVTRQPLQVAVYSVPRQSLPFLSLAYGSMFSISQSSFASIR